MNTDLRTKSRHLSLSAFSSEAQQITARFTNSHGNSFSVSRLACEKCQREVSLAESIDHQCEAPIARQQLPVFPPSKDGQLKPNAESQLFLYNIFMMLINHIELFSLSLGIQPETLRLSRVNNMGNQGRLCHSLAEAYLNKQETPSFKSKIFNIISSMKHIDHALKIKVLQEFINEN